MGLSQALSSAVAGLRVTQSSLAVVSANIANAETPGYVKKIATPVAAAAGNDAIGVRLSSIDRVLDQYVQRQLRTEMSGGAFASQLSDMYQRLQAIYGQPGAAGALETVFNNFTSAIRALATSPDSNAARYGVLSAGQALAQRLNGTTADIQSLRSDVELGLSNAVAQANEAMRRIADFNRQLGMTNLRDATTAALQDQRDYYIDQLSQLVDIKAVPTDSNKIYVFTATGTQLVGDQATVLRFDARGSLSAASQWSSDATKRSVGTIALDTGTGANIDLIATNAIGSGRIAALLQMRDQILPQAQAQLDQIAAAIASALSDRTVAGSPVTSGAQSGFDVDIGSLLSGNTINFIYTDKTTSEQHQVAIVRVDDPSFLPLPATTTPNANNKAIGVDFSGGIASVIAQISSALGSAGLQFSNPSGTTLRVLDDGAAGKVGVNAVRATATTTSLTSGSGELPLFTDDTTFYTGAITSFGLQSLGLAGRIAVNKGLLADPSRLVVYRTSPLTEAGDATRPNFLLDRLTNGVLDYSPQAGIGTMVAPFNGSLSSYIQQMISQQGEAAAAADSLNQGQQVVVNSLQQRFSNDSGVNIDEEMANLLKLQTAYSANARLMTTIRDMLDMLMKV